MLLIGERVGAAKIMRRTALGEVSVWRWQERYVDEDVDGLLRDETRPSQIPKLADEKVAEVIRRTQEEAPLDGGTQLDDQGRWRGGDGRVASPSAASSPRCLRQLDRSPADDR